uniref:Neur_chan_LBD domain-containing protein n=1 Tax=Heterorhabditis bacteriophora TaxID=37862 RepID=A0A1I7XEL1_HETBA
MSGYEWTDAGNDTANVTFALFIFSTTWSFVLSRIPAESTEPEVCFDTLGWYAWKTSRSVSLSLSIGRVWQEEGERNADAFRFLNGTDPALQIPLRMTYTTRPSQDFSDQ